METKKLAKSVFGSVKTKKRRPLSVLFVSQNVSGDITPDKHLEIGRWFGEIESTFYDHPKSPHRDIFRVSNDSAEG